MSELKYDCTEQEHIDWVLENQKYAGGFEYNLIETRDTTIMRETFERAYEAQYGLRLSDMPIEIVAWRLSAQGPNVERHGRPDKANDVGVPKGKRLVMIEETPEQIDIYDRAALAVGQNVAGPTIIEERETTIFILPNWCACVADNGCITASKGI